MTARYTLNKTERLKSRKLLEQLFRDSKTLYIHPFKVYHNFADLPGNTSLQAAFGVSSRAFKKAVDRNRIKRLMREAYRLQKTDLQDIITASGKKLAVFFLYTGKELPQFELVKDKMMLVLDKLVTEITRSNK